MNRDLMTNDRGEPLRYRPISHEEARSLLQIEGSVVFAAEADDPSRELERCVDDTLALAVHQGRLSSEDAAKGRNGDGFCGQGPRALRHL